MKQRIRVVAIIRVGGKVLVLKKSRSRQEAPVFWELPTGKIRFGEQPEEAIIRTLSEDVGIEVAKVNLRDVITFVALEGSSRLDNLYVVYEISTKEKPTPKNHYNGYKYVSESEILNLRLSGATAAVLEIESGEIMSDRLSYRDTANSHVIHVDGASRGNPGPSGIGYAIEDVSGCVIEQGGEFIGFTTSRAAEYFAMKKGIERAIALKIKSAKFISDSMMVVNQLNGIIQPKNRDILPIFGVIQNLLKQFESVSFTHVARSDNQLADREANLAIDNILKP